MKHENKNKNNRRNKQTTKNESNLGFKNGMLGKFVWKKQANIKKGKGKKKKDKETKKYQCFPKGVDGQKAEKKNGVLKGKTKGKPRKENRNRKKRRMLKTGLFGTPKQKKDSKIAGK